MNVRVGFGRWSTWLNSPQDPPPTSLLSARASSTATLPSSSRFLMWWEGLIASPRADEYPPTGLDSAEIPCNVHGMLLWPWRRQLHLPAHTLKPTAGPPAKHSVIMRNTTSCQRPSYRLHGGTGLGVRINGVCQLPKIHGLRLDQHAWLVRCQHHFPRDVHYAARCDFHFHFPGSLADRIRRDISAASHATQRRRRLSLRSAMSIQTVGMLGIIAALLSLRRSFGIVPANRGIRTQGLYNVVRHPLYASELLALGGFAVASPSLWNVSLWLCDFALQLSRAYAEERLLSEDPSYVQYRSRVKYRLIPLII